MKIIDLTHPIEPGMPVYPGDPSPTVALAATHDRDGYEERELTLRSHIGTHVDLPRHLLPTGKTMDDLPAERFMGLACVLDVRDLERVDVADLEPHGDALHAADFAILHTGWCDKWGHADYGSGFPTLTVEAARWLGGFWLKGVGVDALSVDPAGDTELPVHKALLGADMIIVENLANLGALPRDGFLLSALPLKIADGEGSPVRAVGIVCKGCRR